MSQVKEPPGESPISEDELQSALADLENVTPEAATEEQSAAAEDPTQAEGPATGAAANAGPGGGRKLNFKIGAGAGSAAGGTDGKGGQSAPAGRGSGTGASRSASAAASSVPSVALGKRLYRLADRALELVNQPAARVSARVRETVGLVSLVTLGMSLLVIALSPILTGGRSPLDFLEEKKQQWSLAQQAAAAESVSSGPGGGEAEAARPNEAAKAVDDGGAGGGGTEPRP